MNKLDTFLRLRVFESMVGYAMDRWGISHFRLAAECILLSTVFAVASVVTKYFSEGLPFPFGKMAWVLLVSFGAWLGYAQAQREDARYDVDLGVMNRYILDLYHVRLLMVLGLSVVVVVDTLVMFDDGMANTNVFYFWGYLLFILAFVYFLSCQGRPPRRRQRALVPALELK